MPKCSPLADLLRNEIQQHGPISFARFMEQALYHPAYGYYAKSPTIGRSGDFYTSVSVGPVFGLMLARQFSEAWSHLGCPSSFALIEQAGHQGQLAVDVLQALQAHHPACFAATTYHLIEPQPRLQDAQKKTAQAAGLSEKLSWHFQPHHLPPQPNGVFFCNELVDSFPVHRVTYHQSAWHELAVHWDNDHFAWKKTPLSTELLAHLPLSLLPPLENYATEVSLSLAPWITSIAPLLQRGLYVIIDYGFPAELYYHPSRMDGTLQCYHRHQKSSDPFQQVGDQDLTAHVDFTAVAQAATAAGLSELGWTDQHHFLAGLLEQNPELSPIYQTGLKTLLHPEMMGTRFHYLVLEKNWNQAGQLSGLKYSRPLIA